MSCEPVKVQTGNKIDLNLLIFAKIKCLVPEIHYLCIWLEATLARHTINRRSVMLIL